MNRRRPSSQLLYDFTNNSPVIMSYIGFGYELSKEVLKKFAEENGFGDDRRRAAFIAFVHSMKAQIQTEIVGLRLDDDDKSIHYLCYDAKHVAGIFAIDAIDMRAPVDFDKIPIEARASSLRTFISFKGEVFRIDANGKKLPDILVETSEGG